MCGIAGQIAYRDGAPLVDRAELTAVRDAMQRRGPDDQGLWLSADNRVGLAHRRLSILDTSSRALQPMSSADGRARISYNGEIYNFRELEQTLVAKGFSFRTTGDTEVLLELYRDRGLSMLNSLRGMFAFALWDEESRKLYLVRDPFGIKPLYYSDDGQTLRFASSVTALVRNCPINTELDPAGAVGFFLLGAIPEPYTLFRGVRALPAGCMLEVALGGKPQIHQYCSVPALFAEVSQASKISRENRLERLIAKIEQSVDAHLVSDVPIGFFLSAGLDSNILVALAAHSRRHDIHTVTLGFDELRGTAGDESILAERSAKQFGTTHHTKWLKRSDFRDVREDLFDVMDQPSIDGVNSYFVSKVAREAGLTVALSGLGGDELFRGYPSFKDVPRLVSLHQALPFLKSFGAMFRKLTNPLLQQFTSTKYAGVLEYGSSYNGAYLLRRGLFMPWELPQLLDGDLVRTGWNELQPLLFDELEKQQTTVHSRVSVLELTRYMRNQLLRDTDWAGMAHSLEIRVPFIDVQLLVELLALNASGEEFQKREIAQALPQPLPMDLVRREKTGFVVPVREWLMRDFQDQSMERGLRGWAKLVFENYCRINVCTSTQASKSFLSLQ